MELPAFLTQHKYGEIRLTGHRIGLFHVVERFQQGEKVAAIAEYFPSVPLELIQKTIAFYESNRVAIDRYVEAYRAEIERQAAEPRTGPDLAEMRRRMKERDAKTAK